MVDHLRQWGFSRGSGGSVWAVGAKWWQWGAQVFVEGAFITCLECYMLSYMNVNAPVSF